MALAKNAINVDFARELREAGNEVARFSETHLRTYLETLGHQPRDIDQAFEEWYGSILTRLTQDDFSVSGDAAWAAIDEVLGRGDLRAP
jgi:hypothetical protein